MNKFIKPHFYTYDTVEVRYLNYTELKDIELTRGFLFYYTSKAVLNYSNNIILNGVVLGFYNETSPSFMGGGHMILKTCNMVLIEKFDWRLRRALGTHQTVVGDNAVIFG